MDFLGLMGLWVSAMETHPAYKSKNRFSLSLTICKIDCTSVLFKFITEYIMVRVSGIAYKRSVTYCFISCFKNDEAC